MDVAKQANVSKNLRTILFSKDINEFKSTIALGKLIEIDLDNNTLYVLNEKEFSILFSWSIKDLPLMFLALFSHFRVIQIYKTNENLKVKNLVKYLKLFQNFEN